MKNKLIIMIITVLLILTSAVSVFAATEITATLKADKTEVKAGDTFSVTINATCPGGIGILQSTYTYDSEKLELQSQNSLGNFMDLNAGMDAEGDIALMSNATVESADVYVLTFKVKDGVEVNSSAKINFGETYIGSLEGNDEKNIPAQELTITVVEEKTGGDDTVQLEKIEVKTPPTKVTYQKGENFDPAGMVVKAIYSNKEEKEITNYTITDGTDLDGGQKSVTISYTEGNITKTTTQAITVNMPSDPSNQELTKIEISAKPTKLKYIKGTEKLDLTGGKLKLIYSDGTTKEIDFTHSEVAIIGFDNSKLGKNMITVMYRNKTATFEVEIIEESKVAEDPKDTANKEYPKAGLDTILVVGLVAIVIVALVMYRKNKNYEDIK